MGRKEPRVQSRLRRHSSRGDPDLLALSEITGTWLQKLRKEFPQYPYVIAEPQHGGIAIFSRIPMHGEVRYFGRIMRPRIYSKVELSQQTTLIFAHPVIPTKFPGLRNDELELIAQEARQETSPIILAGDLNCTPWSYYFGKLISSSSLRDTEKGFGPQPSWSQFLPMAIFPIDHCLVSSQFTVIDRRLLPASGSDHAPVLVVLELGPEHQK